MHVSCGRARAPLRAGLPAARLATAEQAALRPHEFPDQRTDCIEREHVRTAVGRRYQPEAAQNEVAVAMLFGDEDGTARESVGQRALPAHYAVGVPCDVRGGDGQRPLLAQLTEKS